MVYVVKVVNIVGSLHCTVRCRCISRRLASEDPRVHGNTDGTDWRQSGTMKANIKIYFVHSTSTIIMHSVTIYFFAVIRYNYEVIMRKFRASMEPFWDLKFSEICRVYILRVYPANTLQAVCCLL